MRSLIICPDQRLNVRQLAEAAPLVTLSICGKPFIFYWIEFLAQKGAKQISILATDRPDVVRDTLGDGSRWGINVEVLPECNELTPEDARKKYSPQAAGLLGAPCDVIVADYLPHLPSVQTFSSYTSYIETAEGTMPHATSVDRIGLREIQPGIWAGLHAQIPAGTKLIAPCWIGDHVVIGRNTEIGPCAIVENRSVVDSNASIANSYIAPDTFVGEGTQITNSLVFGSTLVNWKYNSVVRIADPFLVRSMKKSFHEMPATNLIGRLAAFACIALTAPLAFIWVLIANLRSQTVLRKMQAANPRSLNPARRTITYYEFANCTGLWQRWPQLWNICFGEFAWVGNRPLNVLEAEELLTESEKLWLQAPIGLVSQADAEGCAEKFTDEARVHSSFYAVNASFRRNLTILWKVIVGCGKRNSTLPLPVRYVVRESKKIEFSKTV